MQNDVKNHDILSCIFTEAWAYPFLTEFNVQLPSPIALISESELLSQIIRKALSPKSHIVTGTSGTLVEEVVKTTSIWPIIFIGDNRIVQGKKSTERISMFVEMAKTCMFGDYNLHTQIVGLFDKCIPEVYKDDFFKVYLKANDFDEGKFGSYISSLNRGTKIQGEDVKNIIAKYESAFSLQAPFKIALEVAKIVNPKIDIDYLFMVVDQLINWNEAENDIDDVPGLFLNALYQMAESGNLAYYQLPNLEFWQFDQKNNSLYADDNYIYISENCFSEVVNELKSIFPIDIIKRTLRNEKMIISPQNTFTCKMGFVTPFGEYRRCRMIKLRRELIAKAGELEIGTLCIKAKKEHGGLSKI